MNEKALMRKTKAELLDILKARNKKADPQALKKDLVQLILKTEPRSPKAAKKKPKTKAAKAQKTGKKTPRKPPAAAATAKAGKKQPQQKAATTQTTRRKKAAKKLPATEPAASAENDTQRAAELTHPGEVSLREESYRSPAAEPHARQAEPTVAYGPAELSPRYGEDRVTALVRDPYWIFAYWEVTPQALERARRVLGGDSENATIVLRVYDVSGIAFTGENANSSRDIDVGADADNWYINTGSPGSSYCLDIGLRGRGGSFATIARSECVSTPRATPSDVEDDRWLSPEGEFEQIYALSGGLEAGGASPELHELMERQLQLRISS